MHKALIQALGAVRKAGVCWIWLVALICPSLHPTIMTIIFTLIVMRTSDLVKQRRRISPFYPRSNEYITVLNDSISIHSLF
jgi:hypothetical protein